MGGRARLVGAGVAGAAVVIAIAVAVIDTRARPGASATPTAAPNELAVPSASPTPTPTGPQLLLPNLKSLAARELSIERRGDERRLRFSASLANLGPGPLVLIPRGRGNCAANQHSAVQVVHVDRNGDGRFQRSRDTPTQRRFTGCMLEHRGHDHWHFDAMAAYRLRIPAESEPVVSRDKVSFCLRDNARVSGQPATVPRRHFGRCSRTTEQGISPGWADVYKSDLAGQWLRVPEQIDDGQVVCLDLQADPDDLLAETDETDNASTVPIRIDGRDVERVRSDVCG